MSDSNDDFLTARLGDILTIENNDIDSQEEAIPLKCWGRGGTRPSLSKLNFQRLLEISGRCKLGTHETKIRTSPKKLPIFPRKNENIIENITSECHEILGNPRTDKHIAEWLKQNFSEAIEQKQNDMTQHTESLQEPLCNDYNFVSTNSMELTSDGTDQSIIDRTGANNDILFHASQSNNTGAKGKSSVSQLLLSKISDEYSEICQVPSNKLSPSVDKQSTSNSPSDLTDFDKKGIICVPNRSHSFTIENLPNNVTRNDLIQVLSSFGRIENILIRESEGNVTANIRMGAECNCAWIIECLNGSSPFGGSNI